ncbi:MAG: hypothetical protein ABEJ30_06500 [Halorientalis sp.]
MPERRRVLVACAGLLALAGCNTSGPEEPPTTTTTGTPAFTVRIRGGDRTLTAEDGQATVRLAVEASDGEIEEVSWDAIREPSGSTVGVLDYDTHAEVRLSGEGEYAIQVTATAVSGAVARDTVTITVE